MKFLKNIKLIPLHILIGIIIYAMPPLSNIYLVVIIVFFTKKILFAKPEDKTLNVLLACGYIVGAEVFIRMTGGGVLYEASKYMVIVFSILGLVSTRISSMSIIYIAYIVLLIPGIFVAGFNQGTNTVIRKAIAFNLSGPVCLGIVAIFCYNKTIKYLDLQKLLYYIALPVISTTVYLFLFNPSVKDAISSTGSNFTTSGGFGPNQVATVLGFAMFVFTVRFFNKSNSKLLKFVNILLLAVVSYRGIVTFSRGGIIAAIVMIVFFVFYYFKKSTSKNRRRVSVLFGVLAFASVIIWTVSSIETSGFIDKRYNNEDSLGRKKEDVSTGRAQLITFELNTFLENPILGVGVGKVKELRIEKTDIVAASHNEISRILSEHGVFGLIAFAIIFITPLTLRLRNKSNIYFYSFFLFWFLTINHSAMRIAAPAFIYGLSLLNVIYEKPTVHRKQIISKR